MGWSIRWPCCRAGTTQPARLRTNTWMGGSWLRFCGLRFERRSPRRTRRNTIGFLRATSCPSWLEQLELRHGQTYTKSGKRDEKHKNVPSAVRSRSADSAAIDNETRRQHEGVELIASENFV